MPYNVHVSVYVHVVCVRVCLCIRASACLLASVCACVHVVCVCVCVHVCVLLHASVPAHAHIMRSYGCNEVPRDGIFCKILRRCTQLTLADKRLLMESRIPLQSLSLFTQKNVSL